MEKSQDTLDGFESIRIKGSIKAELEEIQDRIRQLDGMRKRPALSDVIFRLIELARERADSPADVPTLGHVPGHQYRRANLRQHDLLEEILEGDNESMREAILRNLRAFAFTVLFVGAKTEEQIDHDIDLLTEQRRAENQKQKEAKKNQGRGAA